MRTIALALLVGSLALAGCAPRNVAAVLHPKGGPAVWDSLSHLIAPDGVAADDRLVLVRVRYENLLKYKHYIEARQEPPAPEGRSSVRVYLAPGNGEDLLLLRFKRAGGDRAVVQHTGCPPDLSLGLSRACGAGGWLSPDARYLQVALPPPGELAYGGRVTFRVEDAFPHRGTRTAPRMRDLAVGDDYAADLEAARTLWPHLVSRPTSKRLAEVR